MQKIIDPSAWVIDDDDNSTNNDTARASIGEIRNQAIRDAFRPLIDQALRTR